ncbi:MAG: TolC family protein [Aquabacterium sp.]|nr:TolC family protein [Ferruginibacter sp.]
MGLSFKGKCYMVSIALLLVPALSLFSQTKKYSLASLADSAQNYLPVLMQKKALANAATASVTDTRHSFLPQLKFSEQLNIGSANSLEGSYFTFGITPSTSGSIRGENNSKPATGNIAVLYSEYELENFGLNDAKLNNAKAYVSLAQSDLIKEQYFISLHIAKLYFNILKGQYRLSADSQNIARYQSIFTVIQALAASGITAGADSSLAKAELSKTKISYNQTLGNISQLKEQLSYLTGIPAIVLVLDTLVNNSIKSRPTEMLFADAASNPLVDYFAQKKNILLTNERLIKKSYLPKILLAASSWARGSSIQYNDDYKALSKGLGYQRFNYAIGIAFTYNLFNGIYKKDKLAINRYQVQASDYELQQQKLALASSVRQADNALQTTRANLTELPVQLKSAEDTYNQKLAQYKAGIISLIDLTNASFVLYRSQADYIETLNDWYLAQLDKAAATGNLISFIQTLK